MARSILALGLVCTFIILVGCPIGPYSRYYKPPSDNESYAFERADRTIYPNDVRLDFSQYDSARVAWPGIILGTELTRTDSSLEAHLRIEHHYYDWIEDFGTQQERIFLSPRGEGLFETQWDFKPETDPAMIQGSVGNMVIVYGIPAAVIDSVITVRAYYVRVIDQQWFATDIFDYGRPGDSVKVLRIPH